MQFMFLSDGVKPQIARVELIHNHFQNGNKLSTVADFQIYYSIVVCFCTFIRLCLIPSTICSICLRNCSLLPDEAMALKKTYTLHSPLPFGKILQKSIIRDCMSLFQNIGKFLHESWSYLKLTAGNDHVWSSAD